MSRICLNIRRVQRIRRKIGKLRFDVFEMMFAQPIDMRGYELKMRTGFPGEKKGTSYS